MSTATQSSPALSQTATEGRRVPFIKLDAAHPELMRELLEVVGRVAHDAAFTLGPEVEDFENNFAAYCETDEAIGVSSGTMALELALRGLGIGPGDEVIVPTYTFIATAEAVSTVGATPVLVDIDPESATITAEIVERALTERTRCVIPVHLFGRTVDMDPILAALPSARHRRDRGCLPGARRSLQGQACWLARRRRLLQLLPDQESRRLGGRRCPRHQQRRAGREGDAVALARRVATP